MNPYVDYYNKQIGKGIPGFKGLRYQRGYGFLSSLLSKTVFPILKNTLKNIDAGKLVKLAGDVLSGPGLIPGKPLADDIARLGATATGTLINTLQGGKGRKYKRRRRKKLKSVAKKRCIKKRRTCSVKSKRRKKKTKAKPKRRSSKKKCAKKRLPKKRALKTIFRKKRRPKRKIHKKIRDALGV